MVSITPITYLSGYKYQLIKPAMFVTSIRPPAVVETDYLCLDKDGVLIISSGYAWDGPSGPALDTSDFMRGSLCHDALYQLMGLALLDKGFRKEADIELRKLCKEDGMSFARRWWVYRAVRRFGGFYMGSGNKVKTAP